MRFYLLKSRRGKLEEKINLELKNETPNVNYILDCIDYYEKDNLETIKKLRKNKIIDTKRISGGLKSTIHAHGPITEKLIGSATKRIYGTLLVSSTKPKYSSRDIIDKIIVITVIISLLILALA